MVKILLAAQRSARLSLLAAFTQQHPATEQVRLQGELDKARCFTGSGVLLLQEEVHAHIVEAARYLPRFSIAQNGAHRLLIHSIDQFGFAGATPEDKAQAVGAGFFVQPHACQQCFNIQALGQGGGQV